MSSVTKVCVVLISSICSNGEQKSQMVSLEHILKGNRILYTEIDCSLEENKETREKYFDISGLRGNYPQVFLQNLDGSEVVYLGSFEQIQQLNELNDLPQELIDANNIKILKSVFADVEKAQ